MAYDLTAEPAARWSKRPGGDGNSGKTESYDDVPGGRVPSPVEFAGVDLIPLLIGCVLGAGVFRRPSKRA